MKEYEHKTEKIYLARRWNSKILVQHTSGHEEQTHAATESENKGTSETGRPLSPFCQGIVSSGTGYGECLDWDSRNRARIL